MKKFIYLYRKTKAYYKTHKLKKTLYKIYAYVKSRLFPQSKMDLGYEPKYPIDPRVLPEVNLVVHYNTQYYSKKTLHPLSPTSEYIWEKVLSVKNHKSVRIPHEDIGFYDQQDFSVFKEQVALAKQFGISHFCFQYLMLKNQEEVTFAPLESLLKHPELDIKYCLTWGNERQKFLYKKNKCTTKTFFNKERLEPFVKSLFPYFNDPRYIKILGKPLLQVHDHKHTNNIRHSIKLIKTICAEHNQVEPYFMLTQTFDNIRPLRFGFDAQVQFPPHTPSFKTAPPLKLSDKKGLYFKYMTNYLNFYHSSIIALREKNSQLYPCVCTGWNSIPKHPKTGIALSNTLSVIYKQWLLAACKFSKEHYPSLQRYVFINAWNNWLEGAYLEPDQTLGYKYLNATARVLETIPQSTNMYPSTIKKILFIGNDAYPAGAQTLLLEMLHWLKTCTIIDCRVVLLKGGDLYSDYAYLLPTLSPWDPTHPLEDLLKFCDGKPDIIFGNTAVAAEVYDKLATWNVPIVTYVHELENILQHYIGKEKVTSMVHHTQHYFAASEAIKDNLVNNHNIQPESCSVATAFIKKILYPLKDPQKEVLRSKLLLPEDKVILLACGTRDYRKGIDMYIQLEQILLKKTKKTHHLIWIGGEDSLSDLALTFPKIKPAILKSGISFVNKIPNPEPFFQAADIFVLPSREDPFPLVALMALRSKLPIVCFKDAGGIPGLIGSDSGISVPYENIDAMAEACKCLIEDPALRKSFGAEGYKKVNSAYTADAVVPQILSKLNTLYGSTIAKKDASKHPMSFPYTELQ